MVSWLTCWFFYQPRSPTADLSWCRFSTLDLLPNLHLEFSSFRTQLPSHCISEENPTHPRDLESEVTQSCLTLCDPMAYSLPGSSVHGIFQVIVLEWIAISFSRGSSQPSDRTRVSCTAGRFITDWATRHTYIHVYMHICIHVLYDVYEELLSSKRINYWYMQQHEWI